MGRFPNGLPLLGLFVLVIPFSKLFVGSPTVKEGQINVGKPFLTGGLLTLFNFPKGMQ
jgi:hypothetical protein